jgi:dipeptidyl aminopeptidase/acylaminoacyl peptidase
MEESMMTKTKERHFLLFLVCKIFLFLTGVSSLAAFEIEDILSAPFPTSLTAAPSGQRIAWVFNSEGIQNIWAAEGPGFQARQLTHFKKDDGRSVRIYGFMHNNQAIVFSKGGRFNPDQDPGGIRETTLYMVGWQDSKIEEIAKTSRAVISPKGDQLAYIQKNYLWLWPGPADKKPGKKAWIQGNLSNLEWSPDGTKLVMQSSRGESPYRYSYITIYDISLNQVKYIDASIYFDCLPTWSADGTKIAFIRRLTHNYLGIITAKKYPVPDPWEVRVADAASGSTRSVWKSPDPDSFSYVNLKWLDNEHLVFASEADGWRHLYSVLANGGKAKQLTPGQFEVEQLVVDPVLKKVFFNCNAEDIDRRHIWSVGLDGKKKAETKGKSIEWSPVLTGDRKFLAFIGSSATLPAQVYVKQLNKGKPIKLAKETLPARFPKNLVTPKQVIFKSEDGWSIHGQLFVPAQKFKGKRPAVMFFHGGPIRQILLGFHYSSYYHRAYSLNQYLASRGYVVLSVNFRLGIGYGRAFREVSDGGPRGGSEYRDLLAGAKYLRSLAMVDSNRLGLWGGSYGGLMTALGLARNSDLFAAGVDFHGVHDWNQWIAWAVDKENDNQRIAWKSSPIADIQQWRSPVLLIHADYDRNVPFSETIWLAKKLKKQGVDCELLIFPDDVHSFLLYRNWVKAYKATASFFDRKLEKTKK